MRDDYRGLSRNEVNDRVRKGLVNTTDEGISKTTGQIVRTHTITYFNIIICFLAVLVIISGQFKNMTFMLIIFANAGIGIFQELRVKKLVDSLAVVTATKAKVIRDGNISEIPMDKVVLDDIVIFESGNQIGTDCIVLESTGIEVNESMITGESISVKKNPGDILYSGSYLVAGSGIARVEHVGKDNYATKLASKAKDKKRATSEMQDSIKRIIKAVGFVIIPIGILLFISQFKIPGMTLSDALVTTVAGVIGMVPEGLVLLTSVSFVVGVGKLAMKKALVQEMEAIEALARVDILCTDKTGTITTGELEVQDIVPVGNIGANEISDIMGEIAFAFDDVNSTQNALMNRFEDNHKWIPAGKIPFSSARKFRAISFEGRGAYALGAPEFLLPEDHEVVSTAAEYSAEGYRVLLLASLSSMNESTGIITGVRPLGLIIISDIIREDAKDTFRYFAKQNVAVKVISGDNPAAVSSIAVKAGLKGSERYIDARDLPDSDGELKKVIDDYTVFGRVTPDQKQRIIKAYQAQGHLVGMVGDGVNDVLALKDADCGIAMAAGSDAAKQVAHIVLLDSNFSHMKEIVREGRMIISNIERVSTLYLTKTIYSAILCVLFIIMGRNYPLIPIHLTVIGACTIGIPSFFLALEQTESVSQNGFMKHVLRISLPGAITMVAELLLVQVIGDVMGLSADMVLAYNVLIAGFVSVMVLINVSSPLNKMRKILCTICICLFIVIMVFTPSIVNVQSIFEWRLILILPLGLLAYWMQDKLSLMMKKIVK